MRGKLFERYILGNWVRITPADAGKTQTADDVHGADRDHPRGCGENRAMLRTLQCLTGSPPRMRGKRDLAPTQSVAARITPADAGKTRLAYMGRRYTRDHPRGCGENAIFALAAALQAGSPPRMRGKLAEITEGM